jgi:hypothetical protein
MRLILLGFLLTLLSCGTASEEENAAMPRPKGFPMMEIPSHTYQDLENFKL